MKYDSYDITYAEVPEEVSLTYSITGCQGTCQGCHSAHLRLDIGKDLLADLEIHLEKYKKLITTVCFLGGSDNVDELSIAIDIVKSHGLKTAIYTREEYCKLEEKIDYLKTGKYDYTLGGLDALATNQKMYKLSNGIKEDITYKFQNK